MEDHTTVTNTSGTGAPSCDLSSQKSNKVDVNARRLGEDIVIASRILGEGLSNLGFWVGSGIALAGLLTR